MKERRAKERRAKEKKSEFQTLKIRDTHTVLNFFKTVSGVLLCTELRPFKRTEIYEVKIVFHIAQTAF